MDDAEAARPDPLDGSQPVPLRQRGIDIFLDVTPENYAQLCTQYGVTDLRPPPPARRTVAAALRSGQQLLLVLPDGYEAAMAVVTCAGQPVPLVMVGSHVVAPGGATTVPMDGVPGPIPVSVADDAQAMVHVELSCVPSSGTMDAWRIGVYAGLVRGDARQRAAAGAVSSAPPARASEALRLNLINQSNDLNNSQVVIFQGGVASADLVVTGGGPGPDAPPLSFSLQNVVMG
jgi:hypothetical protein